MKDDFMPPETYRKGKAKPPALKAHQTMVDGEVVRKGRCWDGLLGCEEYKFKGEFRYHPLLCDGCAYAIADAYGAPRADVELLTLLLHMDAGLYRSAKYLKANPDKVEALGKGREIYIRNLFQSVKAAGGNGDKVKAKIRAFRDWFHAEAEIEVEKPKGAQGFKSLAAMVTP